MLNIKEIFLSLLFIIFFAERACPAQEIKVVFAISPMASPVSTLSSYGDFFKYLSKKTGIKIIPKQRRKYAEINSLLKSGDAQFAVTCTGAFLDGRNEFGLEILAVPVINGKTSYNSLVIVNEKSSIENFSQLRGKVFAFTDPLSFTGRLYPLYVLHQMGVIPVEFFHKSFYTSSHEKSIESVAYGLAEGAAVDSLIFYDMERMEHPAVTMVRIIKVSPPYGIPPIVVSPLVKKPTKQIILTALLEMTSDPEGKEILKKLEIDKYILPDPAIYDNAAQLRKAILLQ
jgi:phosphonate transport system substrate-binding protein